MTNADDADRPGREIVKLGLPLLVGALSSSLGGAVDIAMMGRFGELDLAAVAGSAAIFDIFTGIVLAAATGHQILAARFAGRDDPAGIRTSLRSSAWFCGVIAAALTLCCFLAGGRLAGLVGGGDAGLRHIGAGYLAARAPSLLLLVPYVLLIAVFNAYKMPRYALISGIVINGTNIALDWLLIYGPGGLPRLGATGNGLATSLSWLVGLGCLLVAASRFKLVDLLRRPPVAAPVDFTTSIPKLGWPAIGSMALDYGCMALFFAIIGGIGSTALGGGRIAFEIMVLLFGVGASYAAAIRILVGRSVGAGHVERARRFWRMGQFLLGGPAIVIGLAMALLPAIVTKLFTSFAPVADAAADALLLVAISLPVMAWTLGNIGTLRALGKTKLDMYGNLAAVCCLQLPLAWLLVDVAGMGLTGAFIGVLGYWLARAVITEVLTRVALMQEERKAADRDLSYQAA